MSDIQSSIRKIGRIVAEYRSTFTVRNATGLLSQEKLADELKVSRTLIAHLEEGRELPEPEVLRSICKHLEIPDRYWLSATHPYFIDAMKFQDLLIELIGRSVSLDRLDGVDSELAVSRIQMCLEHKLSAVQTFDQFNSILTFYGERPCSRRFFDRYLGVNAFHGLESFHIAVRRFQGDGMRLYGNFRRAWTVLSRTSDLDKFVKALSPIAIDHYSSRTDFDSIDEIPPERLPDLGYIAVQKIEREYQERSDLATALNDLAGRVDSTGLSAITDTPAKKLRRIKSLLRQFESALELEGPLFSSLSALDITQEAARIAPQKTDFARIRETQQRGLRNLAVYLSEPHMDVYVATSMREAADFISVNAFISNLFGSPDLKPLRLRYFNPTQSWIGDRVAKGLVEALMLRRSRVTVYMAQKGDTFGKDSEASVALGQGKTVIVYVPRLYDEEAKLDSERLYSLDESRINQEMSRHNLEAEEGMDGREKAAAIMAVMLSSLTTNDFKRILFNHWADFDLGAELRDIKAEALKKECASYLKLLADCEDPYSLPDPEWSCPKLAVN
ncbi:MAG: helix-turn-helix domain-containing protein [Planctomycetes bacterium]|nr:helix-turn-helix domain-containing protein [Planctomycetota bacterium]